MKKILVILLFVCVPFFMQNLGMASTGNASPGASNSPDDSEYLEDDTPAVLVADPLSGWNQAMFTFNDKLYFWVLKPVVKGYKAVLPTPVRQGIQNFFHNLGGPARGINCFMQGKMNAAASEMCRFVYDTTFGILGFLDPAKDYPHLNPPEEDLGLTLARYGVGNGCYLVWPVVGPSTLRDSIGLGGDYFLSPSSYIEPDWVGWSLKAEEVVNYQSFHIGDYEDLKNAAIIPYESIKDAYIQYRNKKITE